MFEGMLLNPSERFGCIPHDLQSARLTDIVSNNICLEKSINPIPLVDVLADCVQITDNIVSPQTCSWASRFYTVKISRNILTH